MVRKASQFRDRRSWVDHASETVLVFFMFLLFLVELQPTFTAQPSDPFTILEGADITLEWSYDLGGGTFRRVEFRDVTSSPTVLIVEVDTFGETPAVLHNDYIGRLQVNVTTTRTSITILGANRTVDSKVYEFDVYITSSFLAPSAVTISVQCK